MAADNRVSLKGKKISELDQSYSSDGIEVQEITSKPIASPCLDRLSGLPCCILDCILGRIPIKDAVRTSILSRSWRYKWISLSSLRFDDSCVGSLYGMNVLFVDKLVNIVYRVLLLHCGQVENFRFSTSHTPKFSHFNEWINFLTRNGIRKLSLLYPQRGTPYKLPSYLFAYQGLSHLEITRCLLEPPPTFRGFSNLVSLCFRGFTMDDEGFEILIRNCPLLESLVLTEFLKMAQFTIYAPKLEYLYLDGEFGNILLEHTPNLSDISFMMTSREYVGIQQNCQIATNLVRDLGCLSDLTRLALSGYFLEYLAMSNVLEGFHEFNNLEVLELSNASFYSTNVFALILTILESSSNLQELYISVMNEEIVSSPLEFIEPKLKPNCSFNSLRIMEIRVSGCVPGCSRRKRKISDWRCELELIEFLLARSPILEKVTIETGGLGLASDTRFLAELLKFEQASARSKITYLP